LAVPSIRQPTQAGGTINQDADINSLLDVAEQIVAAAGCASLITMGQTGHPSSRPVAAFPPDPEFSRIVLGSENHAGDRHVMAAKGG